MKIEGTGPMDMAQREAAIDPRSSFVVQAPAGSGKTELLMQRYLNLLSHVEKPEEIIALTFTRKAAGEMQNRILGAMAKAKNGERGTSAHEKKTLELAAKALERDGLKGWAILENPGRLKVQTIDSFCSYLVRQMPFLSGMGGHPAMSNDPAELYAEAAMRTIEMVEDDSEEGECVRSALKHLDNSAVALTKRLVDMLGRRDQWLRHVRRDVADEELRPMLESSLERLVDSTLSGLREAFPQDLVPIFLMSCSYAAKNIESDDDPVCGLAGMTALPQECAKDLVLWKGVRDMLLTKENTLRKTVNKNNGFPTEGTDAKWMKGEFKDLLGRMKDAEGFVSQLAKVRDLPHPVFDDNQWEALSSIVRLLPLAQERLSDVMADLGQSDFQSIAMGAIESLGDEDDPTDLMLTLDMRYSHILVDEYQDTSRVQLELIKGLTRGWSQGDGRTLFIVGDPMQSIYLFREADVGLFIEARDKGIAGINLVPLRLEANFRSQENIVDWVNSTFSGAFSPKEDPFKGAVSYAPSVATRPSVEGVHPQVRLFGRKDDEAEAAEVISLIKTMPSGESVAVLCRSRTHLASIVPALKKDGIGFRAVEIDPLDNRPVVQDLFSLTRALSHPFDKVAWLAILRAPWCGLSLSDLLVLASAGRGRPISSLINDDARLSRLSSDGSERLLRVRDIISKATALRGRADLRGLVEGLWIELGGPACVPDDTAMKDAEAFLSLLDEVASQGQEDVATRLETRLGRLYATHSGADSIKLDIMTIHKAKGLEFDHVILPGLGKKTRNNEKRLMLWMERGDDLLLAPIDKKGVNKKKDGDEDLIYKLLKTVEKEKADLEMVRAFYVACTRAKKGLYLFGHANSVEDGRLKFESTSLLGTIAGSLGPEMISGGIEADSGRRVTGQVGAAPAPLAAPLNLNLKRLSAGWAAPLPAPAIETLARPDEVHQEKEPEFYWAGHLVKHLGTVVHRYMCAIARQGIGAWSGARVDGERANINGMLRSLGLNRDEASEAGGRAVGIIKGALADERGRWVLGPHEEAEVEFPVTSLIDGAVVRSILDRTFVAAGVRWIVDYKTSLHEGGAKEEFLENEKKRYSSQLERYEKALRLSGEKREIKKGLYYPALGGWVEW